MTQKYHLLFTCASKKDLSKIDKQDARRILSWLMTMIDGTENPRVYGKNLVGIENGWRYRIGKYRVLTHIYDNKVLVEVVRVGKRGDVYKK